jgi:hypothetical protein
MVATPSFWNARSARGLTTRSRSCFCMWSVFGTTRAGS